LNKPLAGLLAQFAKGSTELEDEVELDELLLDELAEELDAVPPQATSTIAAKVVNNVVF
jgi:hypothetical protein